MTEQEKKKEVGTFEEIIWDRLVKLTEAMDAEDGATFDRVLQTFEIWTSNINPQMYKEYMDTKAPIDKATEQALVKVEKEALTKGDRVKQEEYEVKEKYAIYWDARIRFMNLLIHTSYSFGYIPFYDMPVSLDQPKAQKETDTKHDEIIKEIEDGKTEI